MESNFSSSLCYFSLLSGVGLMKIFPNVGCCFVLTVSFALQRFFSFMVSHLLTVDLITWAIGILFRKYPPLPLHSRLFPTFSSIRFSVSSIMLRFLIYWDLSFVQSAKCWSICILLYADSQLEQHHLFKILLFLFLFPCKHLISALEHHEGFRSSLLYLPWFVMIKL